MNDIEHGSVPADADTQAVADELRTCPVAAAADVMVRRALAEDTGLLAAALTPSAVIIIEVPSGEWVNPVAEAWRRQVRQTDDVPDDGDDDEAPTTRWVDFRRDGSSRSINRSIGNAAVQCALADGRQVYGFSHMPDRLLPSDLLRTAERRVLLRAPNGSDLGEAIHLYCGARPTFTPPDDEARLVTAGDLILARRPDRDPDAHLRRALSLAAARSGYEPRSPTLSALRGMDDAVRTR